VDVLAEMQERNRLAVHDIKCVESFIRFEKHRTERGRTRTVDERLAQLERWADNLHSITEQMQQAPR
jgi:hypothetical protein